MTLLSNTIVLIRHGQTESKYRGRFIGKTDALLSSVGKKQNALAGKLAKKLEYPIYTSSRERTYVNLVDVTMCVELDEINFGLWEGMNWQEIKKKYPQLWKDYMSNPFEFVFPKGESYLDLQKRVMLKMHRITENKVVIGHAGVIRTIAASLLEIPIMSFFSFELDYGAACILNKNQNKYSLKCWNIQHNGEKLWI